MKTILIPMAGAGSRFKDAGYTISKPVIPTTDRRTGDKIPMVIAAAMDIPGATSPDTKLIFIDRTFHKEDGVQDEIKKYFPHAQFITIDHLTEGQAATCMLAKDLIDPNEELYIGACDCGMDYDPKAFAKARDEADCLVISHSNDANIEKNPLAHSWCKLEADNKTLKEIWVKKTVSDNPMQDHATTGIFWFKRGGDFLKATQTMIDAKDKTGGEYYVDRVIQYMIDMGQKTQYFDITYLCWGTPVDYEDYENTIDYWRGFRQIEAA